MLINEVVTNSLKYAVIDQTNAEIRIGLKLLTEDTAELLIADNGPGFDPNTGHSGMGTKIIKGMVMQLHGSHTYDFKAGTSFSFRFPVG